MQMCACEEYSTTKNELAKFDKISIYEHICNSCGKHRHHSAMGWLTQQFSDMGSSEIMDELEKQFSNHHGSTPLNLGQDLYSWGYFLHDTERRGPFAEHSLPVGVLLWEGEESTPDEILEEYCKERLHNVGKITDNSGLSEVVDALNKKIQRKK